MDPMAHFDIAMTAGQQYATAYAAHYTTRSLNEALDLYEEVMITHPEAPEAGYAATQIRNIVEGAVPAQHLLETQTTLARTYIKAVAVA
jgi:hypothetical protein